MSGTTLGHRLEGEGSPVALANGGMMTFPSWEPVAGRLRARHATLLFDFRGQLLSPGPAHGSLAEHAEDLVELLDEVGLDSTHLLGASFGAEAAIELAARYPDRVRSLTLVTAMDRATPDFRAGSSALRASLAEVLAGVERGRFYDALVESVYSESFREREAATLAARRAQVDQLPLAWFAGVNALLDSIEDFDLTDSLREIRCPVLVVIAENDRVMDRERSEALARALGAEVAVHPTSGHALVVEDPEWLAGVSLDFLARCDGARP
ncbi:MAG: alpha/beta fold hydrolase [Acidobacteria bacterium]|nr:alpha/beta fold hydrolase [Acidobacteriota bacterium]MCB9378128.1 alpha/beta fold hydrolase [Holophagales bacterium]